MAPTNDILGGRKTVVGNQIHLGFRVPKNNIWSGGSSSVVNWISSPTDECKVERAPAPEKMPDKRQGNNSRLIDDTVCFKRRKINKAITAKPILNGVPDIDAAVSILSLPLDVITAIVGYASNDTLISYSQTCHILRLCSSRIYLYRLGIFESEDRYTRVKLSRELPPLAIQILTSFPGMQNFGSIHLICDFFTLHHFYGEICEFIPSCNLSCLQIRHHADESPILTDPTTALALSAVLGSIHIPITTISILKGFRPMGKALHNHNLTSFQKRKSLLSKYRRSITFMDTLRYLKLDSVLFAAPELHSIYSNLFAGATLCSLDLTCSSQDIYQEFVQQTHFPNLQALHLTVRSSFGIYLDEQFLYRHPQLAVVWLLNNPGPDRNGPKTIPVSTRQDLKLPDARSVRISANYPGWTIQDISSLSIFEIQTVSHFTPATSSTFCREVKSLCGIMASSKHRRFPEEFTLGISFPEHFGTHLFLSRTTKDFKCECAVHDSTIDNVGSLKLTFEMLDDNFIYFLQRWLNWFPKLDSLQLESTELKTPITVAHLDALRVSCLNLKSVEHNDFGCSPCYWTFRSRKEGQGVWANQKTAC